MKTFLKSAQKPAKFAREAHTKSAILYQSFFSETGLENSREIGHFFREFVPENPAKFDFFFRDLPEALSRVEMKRRERIKVEGTKTIFFVWRKTKNKNKKNWTSSKYFVLVQKILYWFKNFVLVQKKLYQRQKLNYNKSTSCMRMFDQQFRPNQFKLSFFISECGRIHHRPSTA